MTDFHVWPVYSQKDDGFIVEAIGVFGAGPPGSGAWIGFIEDPKEIVRIMRKSFPGVEVELVNPGSGTGCPQRGDTRPNKRRSCGAPCVPGHVRTGGLGKELEGIHA